MNEELRYSSASRRKSVVVCILAYLCAGVVAFAVGYALRNNHPVLIVGIADLSATVVVFGFSVAFDNSSLYDPYWSVVPVFIALFWALQPLSTDANIIRQVVVMVFLCVWAVRLTFNWFRRWRGLSDEDWRYADFRKNTGRIYWPVSFLGIHLVPTILVFTGCLSLYVAVSSGSASFGVLDVLAVIVTAASIFIESMADRQLHRFLVSRKDASQVLSTGFWAYSRHPNYFGEVLFWWGLFLFALAAGPEYWWVIIGPIAITLLFLFISVPMIEKRMKRRKPGYDRDRNGVSTFFLWLPKK